MTVNNVTVDKLAALASPEWPSCFAKALDRGWAGYSFLNKPLVNKINATTIARFLTEVVENPGKVIDFSCGCGVLLEILHYCGCSVQGTEPPGSLYSVYLNALQIPFTTLDGNNIPYKNFATKSCDYITQVNALDFLEPTLWPLILKEYARIARKMIYIRVNPEKVFEQNRHFLDDFKADGWQLVLQKKSHYKWRAL